MARTPITAKKLGGFLLRIPEGGLFPRGYGYAWRQWDIGEAWCAPMPFNWFVAAAIWLWYAVKHGVKPHALGEAEGVALYWMNKYYNERNDSARLRALIGEKEKWHRVKKFESQ